MSLPLYSVPNFSQPPWYAAATLSEIEGSAVLAKEGTSAAILALVTKLHKMEIGRLKQTDNSDGTKTFEYFEDDAEQILTISFTLDATGKIRSVGV